MSDRSLSLTPTPKSALAESVPQLEVMDDAAISNDAAPASATAGSILIAPYGGEPELAQVMAMVDRELSEPYTIFTYRYFIQQWPQLCFVAYEAVGSADQGTPRELVGVVICKLERHLKGQRLMRGYIGMLSVEHAYRGQHIATKLLRRALAAMVDRGAQEIVLETEADNKAALGLYESLGFIRTKRLFHYYLNGKDSFRLVLSIPQAYWVQQNGEARLNEAQYVNSQDDFARSSDPPPLPVDAFSSMDIA